MGHWRGPAAARLGWPLVVCIALTLAILGAGARAEEPAETGAQHLATYAPPTVRTPLPCATPAELDQMDALEIAWDKAFDAAASAYDAVEAADKAWGEAARDLRAAEAAAKSAENARADANLKAGPGATQSMWERADAARTAYDATQANLAAARTKAEQAQAAVGTAKGRFRGAMDRLEAAIKAFNRLEAVLEKKTCEPPQTPPPPPEPQPPPHVVPPHPVPLPPPVAPTHRTTSCAACQSIVDELNRAADAYVEAVRRHDPDQAHFRAEMARLAKALDDCEAHCKDASLQGLDVKTEHSSARRIDEGGSGGGD